MSMPDPMPSYDAQTPPATPPHPAHTRHPHRRMRPCRAAGANRNGKEPFRRRWA